MKSEIWTSFKISAPDSIPVIVRTHTMQHSVSTWTVRVTAIIIVEINSYRLVPLAGDSRVTSLNTGPWIEHRESLAATVRRWSTRPRVPEAKVLVERSIRLQRVSSNLLAVWKQNGVAQSKTSQSPTILPGFQTRW